MLQTDLLLKLIMYIEAVLSLNKYMFRGIHAWPLVRISLCDGLRDDDASVSPEIQASVEYRTAQRTIEDNYGKIAKSIHINEDRDGDYFQAPKGVGRGVQSGGTCFFLGRESDHYQASEGGFINTVLDPWYELAGESYSVKKLELDTGNQLARERRNYPPQFFSAPSNDAINRYAAEFTEEDIVSINMLLSKLKEYLLHILEFDIGPRLDGILNACATAYYFKRLFDEMFEEERPGALFVSCYYRPDAMGAMWSANEKCIPTLDIQHGVTGYYHYPYSNWGNIPEDGYAVLPKNFVTWSASSANNINRWLPDNGQPHRAFIGGRLDLDPAKLDSTQSQMVVELKNLLKGYRRVILFTSQTIKYTRLTDILFGAIKTGPTDWFWLIRLHPMAEAQNVTDLAPEAVEKRFRETGITNFECRKASGLPIATVMDLVCHHVTGFSSTAFEGLAFGVPTTFTHPVAKIYHVDLLGNDAAYYAATSREINASIETGTGCLSGFDDKCDIATDREQARELLSRIVDSGA